MIYRIGTSFDIPGVVQLLLDMERMDRLGPFFQWTQESLEEELWRYHFVIASEADEFIQSLSAERKISDIEPRELQKMKSKKVAAFIAYRFLGEQVLEVSALATAGDFLRKNVMQNLMQYLINEEKPEEIWLEVHEKNEKAMRFYEKCQFHQVGRRPKYYSDQAAAINYAWKRK